jgi:glucosamine-6-phosphate deaminase
MRIVQTESIQEASEVVAGMILERVLAHPSTVLGLATGKTMAPVYEALVRQARESKVSFEKTSFFMLDEYVGISLEHESSFRTYIQKRVLIPLGIKSNQITFPPADAGNLEAAAADYEERIRIAGGIDLQLLGVGRNGHIGFNEPGSPKHSRTRIVELTESTIEANQSDFPGEMMPVKAMSMGIGTILDAKNLLMLATGDSKAEVIKHILNHHDDLNCPATHLKDHSHFTLVVDPLAASKINLKI